MFRGQKWFCYEKWSIFIVAFDEIAENDFNMNISHYIDTFEKETEVDIATFRKEIKNLEG